MTSTLRNRHLLLMALFILAFSFSGHASGIDSIMIGQQIWSKSNLNVTRFRNGDSIQEAESQQDWNRAFANHQPAWCYLKGNAANARYGRMYNYWAIHDSRGLAPNGWRIPNVQD